MPKRLIEDTKRIIRMRLFLNECRIKLSAGELRKLVEIGSWLKSPCSEVGK